MTPDVTDQYLELAANVAGLAKGQVIAKLVAAARTGVEPPAERNQNEVAIHADYAGHRTHVRFIVGPGRIEITDGPLTGTT